jgi:hypothetical protein
MNINQTTVVIKNASGVERRIEEIPDLWHLSQYFINQEVFGDERDGEACNAILEVWHMAHDLKDAISEDREAELVAVVDPNDLHAVVNHDQDGDEETNSIPLIPNWKVAMDILLTVIQDGTDKGREQAFDELRQLARQVDDLQAVINQREAS